MNVERDVVDGADFARVGGRTATKGRFGQVEDLSQVVDFDDRHRQSLLFCPAQLLLNSKRVRTSYTSRNPFHIPEYETRRFHPAIIGTAASAASMPIVRARLKCSLRKMRARITVTAG